MKVFVFLSMLSLALFTHCSPKIKASTNQTPEVATTDSLPPMEDSTIVEMVDVYLITDILGIDKKITVKVKKKDGILKPLKFTDQTAYYIGILNYNLSLSPQSSLKFLSWEIPMTEITLMKSRTPTSVKIPTFDVGKLAIVHGYSDGGMIYQARIVSVFKQKPIALLMQLLDEEDFVLEEHVRKN